MKRCLSLLLVLLFLVASLPALAAEGMLSPEEVLADGEVVFNDPALQKALEASADYGSYPAPMDYLKNQTVLRLTDLEEPVAEISVLQFCASLETIYLDCAKLASLEPLTKCKKLANVVLSNVGALSLEPLTRCKKLTELQINGDVADLAPVAKMKKLTVFMGLNLGAVDLAPLQKASKLTTLAFDNCACDLSPLAGVKKLAELNANKADAAQLLAVLQARAKTLKTLGVFGTELNAELCAAIGACQKLTALHLAFVSGVDMAALCGAASLEILQMQDVDGGCDFSALSTLKKLQALSLSRVRGASFAGVEEMQKLTTLNLEYVECDDFSFVAQAPKLQGLTIQGCRPRDFSFLSALSCGKELLALQLMAVAVSDLSFVSALPKLQIVYLADTEISDLSPLAGLAQADVLLLYGNPIVDYKPLSGCAFKAVFAPAELPAGMLEYIQSLTPNSQILPYSAGELEETFGDASYEAAVFFGDEAPRRLSERAGETSRSDQAAYDAAATEIVALQKAKEEALLAQAVVPNESQMQYYDDWYDDAEGGVCLYGISVSAPVVLLPSEIGGKPVTRLRMCEHNQWDDAIDTLMIPASVQQIDSLQMLMPSQILVTGDSEHFVSVDGVLYTSDRKTLVCYPGKRNAASYQIPEGVETVGSAAFSSKTRLRYTSDVYLDVLIPSTLKSFVVADESLINISWEVHIGAFIVSPDNETFSAVKGALASKDGKKLIVLNQNAMSYDQAAQGFVSTVPEGIEIIGNCALGGVGTVGGTLLKLPASVKEIEDNRTFLTSHFEQIEVDAQNTSFATAGRSLVSKDGKTLYICERETRETSNGRESIYVIPDGVETIPPHVLDVSGSTLRIPASVREIDADNQLGADIIEVDKGNTQFSLVDGMLLGDGGKTLRAISGTTLKAGGTITVPDGVTVIEKDVCGWPYLPEVNLTVVLPDTVTTISEMAFDRVNMASLTIEVPASVTLVERNSLPMWERFLTIVTPKNSPMAERFTEWVNLGYEFPCNLELR